MLYETNVLCQVLSRRGKWPAAATPEGHIRQALIYPMTLTAQSCCFALLTDTLWSESNATVIVWPQPRVLPILHFRLGMLL